MDSQKSRSFLPKIILLIIIIGIAFGGYYLYQRIKKTPANPKAASFQDGQNTLEKVGKLIELPKDEVPTLATVSDKKKLADQAFFKNAENGDKVLIYQKSRKAIIYRPSTNKIIEVGPVNLAPEPSIPSASSSASSPIASPSGSIAPIK